MDPLTAYFLGIASTLLGIVIVWWLFRILGPWAVARAANMPVTVFQLIGMRLRKTDPQPVLTAALVLTKRGHPMPLAQLEAIYMTLPENRRDVTSLLRAARPDLNLDAPIAAPSQHP